MPDPVNDPFEIDQTQLFDRCRGMCCLPLKIRVTATKDPNAPLRAAESGGKLGQMVSAQAASWPASQARRQAQLRSSAVACSNSIYAQPQRNRDGSYGRLQWRRIFGARGGEHPPPNLPRLRVSYCR